MDTPLVTRVRKALADAPSVEEKRMFGGTTFMVNGKMCVSAGTERLMCRIDPAIHDQALQRDGCETVTMAGRQYRGYVYIDKREIRSEEDFQYWIGLALAFNRKARRAAKRTRPRVSR